MNNTARTILLILSLMILGVCQAQEHNVLFIAVDDLKPLLGAYGDEMAITPNIDRLAKMGVIFTNTHCQQAVCAPSRISLLTGLRPDLTEVWDLKTQMRDKNREVLTLPQYFRENGYTTVGMGKIFDPRSVDNKLDRVSWSIPYIMPDVNDKDFGKPAVSGYQSAENKEVYEALKAEAKKNGLEQSKYYNYLKERHKPSTESVYISDEGYFDGALAREAVRQLAKLAKDKNPFLLCVGFRKPHLPFVAPKKYWDLYDRRKMPLAKFQRQAAGTVKLSYHNIGELKSYTDIPDAFDDNGLLMEDKQRELIHGYYACISYIDAQIGKILDEIAALGLGNNTSIVLWGDHGWHLGDHGLWNKHSNFEQATRSPLIFVSPGLKQGLKNDSPTEFVDIFPTLCDLTGLPKPDNLQGESLVPILTGNKKKVKEFAISQYPRANVMGYALRNDRYRYVAWYKERNVSSESNILVKELYDYKKDPLEKVNTVASNKALAEKFQAQLTQFLREQNKQKREFKKSQKTLIKKAKNDKLASVMLSDNLITNPGFEDGEKKWHLGKGCPVKVVKGNAKSGEFSLQFTGTKCSAFQVLENLSPETTYKVTVYAKTKNKETVLLKVRDYGGEDIVARYQKSSYGALTTTFTTGKENRSARIALVKYKKDAKGKSWFDDVTVEEVKDKANSINSPAIKDIINDAYDGKLYIGATIGFRQLGTPVEDILINQYNYTVPENAGKQAQVHPEPGIWNWERIDAIIKMAEKNNLTVRLHGPISPQASPWAKGDRRTPKELEKVMVDYMVEQCKRFNGHPNIKWMDVVNETVDPKGQWFGPKPGTDKWENPWTIVGSDHDKNQTPIYISKAFELANKYAPDISLVYNQHGGMEPAMWERVKETILYLRQKGLRVDGLGWQAHLRSDLDLAFDKEQLNYLSSLIDWAHTHDLGFHVTEIDYKIKEEVTQAALKKQSDAYANILRVLLSKRASGLVTYNTWGLIDGVGRHKDLSRFMFDENGKPKPAYFAVKEALLNPESKVVISNQKK